MERKVAITMKDGREIIINNVTTIKLGYQELIISSASCDNKTNVTINYTYTIDLTNINHFYFYN